MSELDSGGAYESDDWSLVVLEQGRARRMEFFELEHVDQAVARFAQWTSK